MPATNIRPEIFQVPIGTEAFGIVKRPLSATERVYNLKWLRKTVIVCLVALAWQMYARWLDNPLVFPSFADTVASLGNNIASGVLIQRAWTSIQLLIMGYLLGVLGAGLLILFAMTSRLGSDFLETMTSIFNPLPAIALLPLALTWFGLGYGSLVFVLVHSVLWVVALNTHSGFLSVSPTLQMVGRNYGLKGPRLILRILIPAALASILTGLKIGWAFAWRTLIAAELVFGVSSGRGGLGWFIYERKNMLETADVFAGLLAVIIIGLAVENLVFRPIEKRTVKRWGMQT